MGLLLQDVDKIVGREVHLKDISLDLAAGSRNVIIGRTLAGKTSLLRIMAGLDRPASGRITMDGRDITGVSVRKRSVAMVYQQFINYPSLTVYNNIASPLKLAGIDKKQIDRRVRQIAQMLHIENLLDRLPAGLSGGQQQRTAIARALIKETELLLLDEPLVNLDYKLREQLRLELQEIFKRRKAIVVYTTTEPAEALMLGGNIIVMDQGRILQTGPAPNVYHNPITTRVAEVFSDPPINYLEGSIHSGKVILGENICFTLNGRMSDLEAGDYRFGVRSNHFFLNPNGPGDIKISATVELSEINGSETFIHIRHGDTSLVVQNEGVHQIKIGSAISVYVNPSRFFVYDKQGLLKSSPTGRIHQTGAAA
ncbi:MAG: ABC transporter ATP-binding protein [Desulfobacteraceae bacterium]|nr:ABC transporter ATP-binding protein [Desulfobacteraceae bacterium]